MNARAVVVEDEPLARQHLREMLVEHQWLDLIGEAGDGPTAVDMLNRLRPAVVFLDIELPGLSGLDVLRALRYTPVVVFTTAFDRFAVSAFELAAVDYLLKPFARDRLEETLVRVQRALGSPPADAGRRADALLHAATPVDRLFVRDREAIVPVVVREIERLEADDDYVAIHVRGKRFLVAVPMNEMERRLDPENFLRVHRSHMVNLAHVASLTPYDASRLVITMKGGARLIASRASSRKLRELAL